MSDVSVVVGQELADTVRFTQAEIEHARRSLSATQ